MVSLQKKQKVEKLQSLIQEAGNFFLIKYGSIPHQQLESIRKKLRENKSKLKVVKNSLFQKAVNKLSTGDQNYKTLAQTIFPLKENTAVVLDGEDIYAVVKMIADFAKEYEELEFKGGLLEGQIYDKSQLAKIATLPSRDQLIAKIYSSVKSPFYRLSYALKFNQTKIYLILKQIAEQKKDNN